MKIDLREYLTRRHKVPSAKQLKNPGPVITISREYGCEANILAEKLMKTLSKKGPDWSIISKEILEEASRELQLHPSKLEKAFTPHERNFIEEMFSSFSTKIEIPDKRIYEIIQDVIYTYSIEGNVIIVGRGGVAISRDIPRSLHIRLIAPMEYRTRVISEKRNISLKRAREIVSSQDQRRRLFIQKLRGEVVDHTIFDMAFNTVSLTDEQIIETILAGAKAKKLIT